MQTESPRISNHKLLAIRINTSSLETQLEFFRALGVDFKEKKIKNAGSLYSGLMGDLEVIVSDSLSAKQAGQPLMSVRLEVRDLEEVWNRIKLIPGLETVMDLQDLPDGKTAVVLDPDGRAFELTESVAVALRVS